MALQLSLDGEWLNTSQENMDKLLQELGTSWMKRKAAAAMNFGCGSHKQVIKVDGDMISITTMGRQTFSNEINVGGGEQLFKSPEGDEMGYAEWGSAGELIQHTKMQGKPVVITRRVIDDKTFAMEIDTGKVKAVRVYSRQ